MAAITVERARRSAAGSGGRIDRDGAVGALLGELVRPGRSAWTAGGGWPLLDAGAPIAAVSFTVGASRVDGRPSCSQAERGAGHDIRLAGRVEHRPPGRAPVPDVDTPAWILHVQGAPVGAGSGDRVAAGAGLPAGGRHDVTARALGDSVWRHGGGRCWGAVSTGRSVPVKPDRAVTHGRRTRDDDLDVGV
jgi:hypothetical protein